MPIIMRKVMRHISAPELRVLVYLQTRCSVLHLFSTLEEIVHDLGLLAAEPDAALEGAGEEKVHFHRDSGRQEILPGARPLRRNRYLVETGKINENELAEINRVLEDLNRTPITATPKPATQKVT